MRSVLRPAELVSGDFETVLARIEPGDFVYLDPPFNVRSRRVFRQYSASVFGEEDLERLRQALALLDRLGAAFLVSYADSAEARRLSVAIMSMRRRPAEHRKFHQSSNSGQRAPHFQQITDLLGVGSAIS